MAKLRRNHNKNNQAGSTIIRVIGFLLAVGLMMYFLYGKMTADDYDNSYENTNGKELQSTMLPTSSTGDVVHHTHYSLSYDEDHEQAEWVSYKLTEKSLKIPNVKRAKRFNTDPMIPTRSAHHRDYTRSGYTRGHMAPAGDMAFDAEAMQESFYMSNMSPQLRELNGGIWQELEETVRDWAYHNDEVYIVTGPVLTGEHIIKKIGKSSKISVTDLFYKIVLDYKKPEQKAIAFLIPHEVSERPLQDYAVSIMLQHEAEIRLHERLRVRLEV